MILHCAYWTSTTWDTTLCILDIHNMRYYIVHIGLPQHEILHCAYWTSTTWYYIVHIGLPQHDTTLYILNFRKSILQCAYLTSTTWYYIVHIGLPQHDTTLCILDIHNMILQCAHWTSTTWYYIVHIGHPQHDTTVCILDFHNMILHCAYWTSQINTAVCLHIELSLPWPLTRRRTCWSYSRLYLQRHYFGYPRRLACPSRCVKEWQGRKSSFLPLSRNTKLLACREVWSTAYGLKYLLPKVRYIGHDVAFLLSLISFVGDVNTHIERACGMLQILVPFSKSPPIYWNKGVMLCCHVLAYLTAFSSIRQSISDLSLHLPKRISSDNQKMKFC
jgi:hypothetical protein